VSDQVITTQNRPEKYIEYGQGPGSPVLPEVPYAVVLPAAGAAIAGGLVLLRRRRRPSQTA